MPPTLTDRLNKWRKEETEVLASTTNGEEFEGVIDWFDNYNISLETEDGEVVLFKGTMAYIKPVE